jgi:hypothetical protein
VAHDVADLASTIEWARANDAAARAIALEGQGFAQGHLGRAEAFLYLLAVLERLAHGQQLEEIERLRGA